jgi:hypothetical protein
LNCRICLVVTAIVLLAIGCGKPESRCPPTAVGSWRADGKPEIYAGDDLFIYINGGAEVYHEYGFVRAAVQRYLRGEDTVTAEIYSMDGNAYGIYSFARSASGQSVELGDGATSADHYLHVWSGPDLAVITADTEFEDRDDAVLEIATAIAGCLQPGGVEPDLVRQLPMEGRTAGSEVYFTGRLAFLNVARPAASLFVGYDEGAAADYASGEQIVLLRFNDEAAATRALEAARQSCAESDCSVVDSESGGVTVLESGRHRILVSRFGNGITLRVQREEP